MPLYVVAFPRLAPADLARIEDVRGRFDPQFGRLAPHVTMVFGTERLDVASLSAHVTAVTRDCSSFACTFRSTAVVQSSAGGASHVFLVPREGYAEIDRLHGALYTGPLAPDLRRDIPFVPHVTVAQLGSEDRAREVAAAVDLGRGLEARIDALDVVAVSADAIVGARTITLK